MNKCIEQHFWQWKCLIISIKHTHTHTKQNLNMAAEWSFLAWNVQNRIIAVLYTAFCVLLSQNEANFDYISIILVDKKSTISKISTGVNTLSISDELGDFRLSWWERLTVGNQNEVGAAHCEGHRHEQYHYNHLRAGSIQLNTLKNKPLGRTFTFLLLSPWRTLKLPKD